jgi:hypothetical protein
MTTNEPTDLWESAAGSSTEPVLELTVWDALLLARTPRTSRYLRPNQAAVSTLPSGPNPQPVISRKAVA